MIICVFGLAVLPGWNLQWLECKCEYASHQLNKDDCIVSMNGKWKYNSWQVLRANETMANLFLMWWASRMGQSKLNSRVKSSDDEKDCLANDKHAFTNQSQTKGINEIDAGSSEYRATSINLKCNKPWEGELNAVYTGRMWLPLAAKWSRWERKVFRIFWINN